MNFTYILVCLLGGLLLALGIYLRHRKITGLSLLLKHALNIQKKSGIKFTNYGSSGESEILFEYNNQNGILCLFGKYYYYIDGFCRVHFVESKDGKFPVQRIFTADEHRAFNACMKAILEKIDSDDSHTHSVFIGFEEVFKKFNLTL